MDCSLIVFDFANKQLHIAAANNPVWIIRNNNLIEIKPDKIPVGRSDKDHLPFTLHTIDVASGDCIYTPVSYTHLDVYKRQILAKHYLN